MWVDAGAVARVMLTQCISFAATKSAAGGVSRLWNAFGGSLAAWLHLVFELEKVELHLGGVGGSVYPAALL